MKPEFNICPLLFNLIGRGVALQDIALGISNQVDEATGSDATDDRFRILLERENIHQQQLNELRVEINDLKNSCASFPECGRCHLQRHLKYPT